MDTSNHYSMNTLFAQLGLPSETEQINQFLSEHRLVDNQKIIDDYIEALIYEEKSTNIKNIPNWIKLHILQKN